MRWRRTSATEKSSPLVAASTSGSLKTVSGAFSVARMLDSVLSLVERKRIRASTQASDSGPF